MNQESNKCVDVNVEIDRSKWLRIRSDGGEPLLGLKGEPARDSIFLASKDKDGFVVFCVMGFVLKQSFGLSDEKLQGVEYPSNLGIDAFARPVAGARGRTTRIECEIAAISERRGLYQNYSDEQIEAALTAITAAAGFRLNFVDGHQ